LDPRSTWVVDSVRNGQPVTLFVDELRCPVAVADLVAALWELAAMPEWPPVLHVAGPEALSRYALGLLVANYAGVSGAELGSGYSREQLPPRPRDLRLDTRLAERLLQRCLRPVSELFAR
jgi:dTDP-4-dehydrorhamnose reductase